MSIRQTFAEYTRDELYSFDVEWTDTRTRYKVESHGPGGFDSVTRPDLRSAKEAAAVHERVTGNECDIVAIE